MYTSIVLRTLWVRLRHSHCVKESAILVVAFVLADQYVQLVDQFILHLRPKYVWSGEPSTTLNKLFRG